MKILFALGHVAFEEAIKNGLNIGNYQFCEPVTYREMLLSKVNSIKPDILVARETLTGNAVWSELLYEIRNTQPKTRIIFVSKDREAGDSLLVYLVGLGIYDLIVGENIGIKDVINLIENKSTFNDVARYMPKASVNEASGEKVYETKIIEVPTFVNPEPVVEQKQPSKKEKFVDQIEKQIKVPKQIKDNKPVVTPYETIDETLSVPSQSDEGGYLKTKKGGQKTGLSGLNLSLVEPVPIAGSRPKMKPQQPKTKPSFTLIDDEEISLDNEFDIDLFEETPELNIEPVVEPAIKPEPVVEKPKVVAVEPKSKTVTMSQKPNKKPSLEEFQSMKKDAVKPVAQEVVKEEVKKEVKVEPIKTAVQPKPKMANKDIPMFKSEAEVEEPRFTGRKILTEMPSKEVEGRRVTTEKPKFDNKPKFDEKPKQEFKQEFKQESKFNNNKPKFDNKPKHEPKAEIKTVPTIEKEVGRVVNQTSEKNVIAFIEFDYSLSHTGLNTAIHSAQSGRETLYLDMTAKGSVSSRLAFTDKIKEVKNLETLSVFTLERLHKKTIGDQMNIIVCDILNPLVLQVVAMADEVFICMPSSKLAINVLEQNHWSVMKRATLIFDRCDFSENNVKTNKKYLVDKIVKKDLVSAYNNEEATILTTQDGNYLSSKLLK